MELQAFLSAIQQRVTARFSSTRYYKPTEEVSESQVPALIQLPRGFLPSQTLQQLSVLKSALIHHSVDFLYIYIHRVWVKH